MKPRRTANSNVVYQLVGGTEDNDLWVAQDEDTLTSTWELDEDERAVVAAGGTIDLIVWGRGTPPVALTVGPPLEERK